MKIVVLDGYAANPGDLNWDSYQQGGDHGRTHGILAQPEVYWRNSHRI